MMSEKLKTIKELADELGVSKQGVRYHMKSIPQKELKKNGSVAKFKNQIQGL